MTILISILHFLICVFLIVVILLQAGRGHGLAGGSLGGESTQSLFGTKTNSFMTRLTTTVAILFICTSLGINIINSFKSKSLVMNSRNLPLPVMPEVDEEIEVKDEVEGAESAASEEAINETENVGDAVAE